MAIYISNNSKSFLQKLITQIYEAFQEYNNSTIESFDIGLLKGNDYHIIPRAIQKKINTNKYITGKKYVLNISDRIYNIHIFDMKEINNLKIDTHIIKIYAWLYVLSKYSTANCSKQMDVFIYHTNNMKKLPTKGSLSPYDVNTAFTTSCKEQTEINIFRNEEWFKVFIHETFHNHGLDFSGIDNTQVCKYFRQIFDIKKDVGLYETYCEMWAEIIFLLFYSFEKLPNKYYSLNKILYYFYELVHHEQTFSMFQCIKTLKYNNLSYYDLYDPSIEAKNKRKSYREESEIFAYYILKAILMIHINDFIEFCINNNTNVLNFNKTTKNMIEYCNLFKKLYNSKEFLNFYDILEPQVDIIKHKNLMDITMRMTLYG